MSEELSGILKFLNDCFTKFKTLTSISDINDPEYIDKVLRDAENNYFQDMNFLPSDSEFNKQYNLRIIYTRISSYYEYVIKKKIETDFFDYKDNSDENFLKLAELIIGVCVKSNKEEYFEVLNNLTDNESNEIYKFLSDWISPEEEKEEDNNNKSKDGSEEKKEADNQYDEEEEDKINENAMLWIRAENAEKENERMSQEMNELHEKITELTKSNYTLELNLKETESKYQELVSNLKKEETDMNKKKGNDVNLNIKISELKGKLEAKTKSFFEYQEEKEKLVDELNNKINALRKENLALKEIKVKYDVLQNELKKLSFEDMTTIKQRLNQCERTIKEQEEEINRLKSNENQDILLKKIEDLNKQKSLIEDELNTLQEENENIKTQIMMKDCEITQLKENLGIDPQEENNEQQQPQVVKKEEIKEKNEGISLGHLVEEENKNNNDNEAFNELEEKAAQLEKEKNELTDKIKELNEKIKELNGIIEKDKNNMNKLEEENHKIKELNDIIKNYKNDIEKSKEENQKLKQKLEKNKQLKEENKTFVKKLGELMDKLDENKNENMKLTKEKNDIKNEYIIKINKLEKDINEYQFKLQEKENMIKKLELEKEKNKENINEESLRLQNMEIKNNEKFKEFEQRLKILNDKESTELKEQLKEKNENYVKLEEKYKKLEEEYNEMNKEMEKIPEEIKKKEDAIEYLKKQLDFKENTYNEEIRILSMMYHRLSFQCAKLRQIKESETFKLY